MAVSGTYKQSTGGGLNIAIAGPTASTAYDQLKVTGAATLTGSVNLSLLNGYVPTVGSSFEILTSSAVSGQFSTTNGSAINGGEHFVVTCDPTYCDATVASGAASGVSRINSKLQLVARADRASFNPSLVRGLGDASAPRLVQSPSYNQAPLFRPTPASPLALRAAALANPLSQHGRGRRGTSFGVDLMSLFGNNPRNLMKRFAASSDAPIAYVASTVN